MLAALTIGIPEKSLLVLDVPPDLPAELSFVFGAQACGYSREKGRKKKKKKGLGWKTKSDPPPAMMS